MKISEKRIKQIILEEYENRLLQYEIAALAEADVVDEKGNVLLSKDLKVRHKESGYEYTIDSIEGEGENMIIHLRKPDVPRLAEPMVPRQINELDDEESVVPVEDSSGSDIFTVTAEEFANEYIVD